MTELIDTICLFFCSSKKGLALKSNLAYKTNGIPEPQTALLTGKLTGSAIFSRKLSLRELGSNLHVTHLPVLTNLYRKTYI